MLDEIAVAGAVEVLVLSELAFLLFLARLEIEPERLRGRTLTLIVQGCK